MFAVLSRPKTAGFQQLWLANSIFKCKNMWHDFMSSLHYQQLHSHYTPKKAIKNIPRHHQTRHEPTIPGLRVLTPPKILFSPWGTHSRIRDRTFGSPQQRTVAGGSTQHKTGDLESSSWYRWNRFGWICFNQRFGEDDSPNFMCGIFFCLKGWQ